MDTKVAIEALAALAQEHRLRAFRLLVRAGSEGLAAGAVARELGLRHNTLSTHLAALTAAGLVTSRREGRSIIYRVELEGTRDLLAFLLEDCCLGTPERCDLALATVLPTCCSPAEDKGVTPS